MAYRLIHSDGNYVQFGISRWSLLLDFARAHGWEPEGVGHLEMVDLSTAEPVLSGGYDPMDYHSNGGQIVHDSDAAALADAWERGLASAEAIDLDADNVSLIRDLIPFCRASGFIIG